jgi:retron-type reverse transcriptase
LARQLGVELDKLQAVEPRYEVRLIPMKRGGQRRLLIPAPELKKLQRRILHRLLQRLRAHPAAHGFEKNRSIVTNAQPHVGRRVVIKLDIVDFFPTTDKDRVEAYFRRIGWDAKAAALLTRLVTHEHGLPQGAPTSPRLSNLVNFGFDAILAWLVARRKGAYTRYADDITISFPKDYPRRVRGVIQFARKQARIRGYRIHTRGKLRILRPHQQQRVTGLVVNRGLHLPRKQRRRLRAVQHHLKHGRPATLTIAQLHGWLGLMQMIERQGQAPQDRGSSSA